MTPKRSELLIISFLYRVLRRMLEFTVLLLRREEAKEVEIFVLRHQLTVLRATVARPELKLADRALLACRGPDRVTKAWHAV